MRRRPPQPARRRRAQPVRRHRRRAARSGPARRPARRPAQRRPAAASTTTSWPAARTRGRRSWRRGCWRRAARAARTRRCWRRPPKRCAASRCSTASCCARAWRAPPAPRTPRARTCAWRPAEPDALRLNKLKNISKRKGRQSPRAAEVPGLLLCLSDLATPSPSGRPLAGRCLEPLPGCRLSLTAPSVPVDLAVCGSPLAHTSSRARAR